MSESQDLRDFEWLVIARPDMPLGDVPARLLVARARAAVLEAAADRDAAIEAMSALAVTLKVALRDALEVLEQRRVSDAAEIIKCQLALLDEAFEVDHVH